MRSKRDLSRCAHWCGIFLAGMILGCLSACAPPVMTDVNSVTSQLDALLQQTVTDSEGRVSRNVFLYIDAPTLGLHYSRALGLGRVEPQKEADASQQFIVASVAKSMTATIIYQMVEEERFGSAGIDATLAELDVLPEDVISSLHRIDGVSYGDQITLRHLLNHTSGMRDLYFDGALNEVTLMPGTADGADPNSMLGKAVDDERYGLEALVSCSLQGQPQGCTPQEYRLGRHWNAWDEAAWRTDPQDEMAGLLNYYLAGMNEHALWYPGEGFHYSDTNYVLLGLVIEKMSGNSLHQELRSRIFDPLGMEDSYLVGAAQPAFEMYEKDLSESWAWNEPAVSGGVDFSFDWGGGGVVSTLDDLATFTSALSAGQLFQQDATLQQMYSVPQDVRGIDYASGLIVFPSTGGPVIYMMGSNGTWAEYYAPFDLVVVGTTNDFSDMPSQFQFHGKLFALLAANGLPTPMAEFFSSALMLIFICLAVLWLLDVAWVVAFILQRRREVLSGTATRGARWGLALSFLFNLVMLFLMGADLGSNMFQMLFGLGPALKSLLDGAGFGMGLLALLMLPFVVHMQRMKQSTAFERTVLTLVNIVTLLYAVALYFAF